MYKYHEHYWYADIYLVLCVTINYIRQPDRDTGGLEEHETAS